MNDDANPLSQSDLLELLREELRHWPYTIHQIDDTLDSSLIEGRAKQILFQALNSGLLTAFVGSGVSAAYGRLSWSGWQDAQLALVEDLSKKFRELARAADIRMQFILTEAEKLDDKVSRKDREKPGESARRLVCRWLRQRRQLLAQAKWEIDHLFNTFVGANSQDGYFPGGEDLPVKFEIAKKLHDLLLRHRGLFLFPEETYRTWSPEKKHKNRAWVETLGTKVDPKEGAPAQECDELIRQIDFKSCGSDIKAKFDAYLQLAKRPEARISFEDYAKTLLVDEVAHSEALLLEGIAGDEKLGQKKLADEQIAHLRDLIRMIDKNALRRDIDGIRDAPDRFRVLSYFTIDRMKALLSRTNGNRDPHWAVLIQSMLQRLDEYDTNKTIHQVDRTYLTPTSRFLLPMVLALHSDPRKALADLADWKANGKRHEVGEEPEGYFGLGQVNAQDYASRRSLIADRFDPLDKTIRHLKINHYLTTNYDFEIERQYLDRGFRRFDSELASPYLDAGEHALNPQSYRTDGMGAVMRDMTFSQETAVDLLTFAAGGDRADASIFHLHGRATRDDRIIVTERDYMDMYLRKDPHRDDVDESILMAFASTPILFLGLGMNEADMLRPLRQFISDEDRAIGYRAIVLLPATENYFSRTKMAAGLYMRYGAHTIFFGGGYVEVAGMDGKPIQQPIDWLHRVWKLISTIEDAIDEHLQKDELDLECRIITPNALDDALGPLGNDLSRRSEMEPEHRALPILMGIDPRLDWKNVFQSQLQAEIKAVIGFTRSKTYAPAGFGIRNCIFTTRRDISGSDRQKSRLIATDGAAYNQFYTEILNRILVRVLDQRKWRTTEEAQRSLKMMQRALQGLKAACLTACFNAALDGIEREWRAWWKDWQEPPAKREAMFEEVMPLRLKAAAGIATKDREQALDACPFRQDVILPRRLVRHRVISVITDILPALECLAGPQKISHVQQIAYSDGHSLTRVRVFDTFIYDVAAIAAERKIANGRLMHSVAARRGQGKGAFFSFFNTPLGLTSYIRAAHPEKKNGGQKPFIITACFINLSFAAEVASIYDMLERTLFETVSRLWAMAKARPVDLKGTNYENRPERFLEVAIGASFPLPHDTAKAQRKFQTLNNAAEKKMRALEVELNSLPRMPRIFVLMQRFKDAGVTFRKRNCLGLKLTPRLLICINAVELLFGLGKLPKNMEIRDLLCWLLSDDAKELPFDLVTIGDQALIGHPMRGTSDLNCVTIVRPAYPEKVRRAISGHCQKLGITEEESAEDHSAEDTNYVHTARPIEPRDFLIDNFFPLALALYVARLNRTPESYADALSNIRDYEESLRECRHDLFVERESAWHERGVPDVNEVYQGSRSRFEDQVSKLIIQSGVPIANDIRNTDSDATTQLRENMRRIVTLQDWDGPDDIPPDAPDQSDQDDWKNLQTVLSGNRFCLTILLAAAQHLAFSASSFIEGGVQADRLLKNVVSRVRNASVSHIEDVVLETVMGVYRATNKIGDADQDHELHTLLLRNIAVIGCPVSPNVIVRLPDVRHYFNTVAFDDKLSRRRRVARALAVLSERGLAFRLGPHPKLLRLQRDISQYDDPEGMSSSLQDAKRSFDNWPARRELRYALHRQVQSYCFKRLGHLSLGHISANSFAPTLYSSMPSRVVRLSKEGYLFLRRLMLGLSQYPDIRQEDSARDRPIFNDDDVVTRAQALRAALSMVRGTFSIAAISRFTEDSTGLDFARKRGYFETYKVRLRWILRKAWEIHEPHQGLNLDRQRVHSLYRDEIIWLYNEVAVTCLVQGNLVDAIGHARQALHLNQEIEGKGSGGRMQNIISLNLAIMQMERGRLLGARRRLEEIKSSEKAIRHRIFDLACGYLALVDHLSGQREQAGVHFESVIAEFRKREEDRALAIMLDHYAHLVAQTNTDRAASLLEQAREHAAAGGHEDVRNRVLLSEVWLSHNIHKENNAYGPDDGGQLAGIERYARMMGLDSLLVDCLHLQGRILLSAGDSSSSGRLIARAMAIARRNDLNLRLNSIMTSYASVLRKRDRPEAARRLLDASLTLAKRHQFGLEVIRIHEFG